MGYLVFGLLLGLVLGYLFVSRPKRQPYLAHTEYWVYLPGETMPPQDAIMTQLVRPEIGRAPVGPSEALLFSDVRLHIALVLRSKNAHVFRPDLMEPHIELDEAQRETLDTAKSLVKVRFVSEEPLKDRRHLSLLAHTAVAIAELGRGEVVYDTVAEKVLKVEEVVGASPLTVLWKPDPTGGHVETRGLKKMGLPEFKTDLIAADERWIATEIVSQVAHMVFDEGELGENRQAAAFDDRFRFEFDTPSGGYVATRIHRIQDR